MSEQFDIDVADKDALEAYAFEQHGVNLDKRQGVDKLRDQVKQLDAKAGQPVGNGTLLTDDELNDEPGLKDLAKGEVIDDREYLFNPATKVVFPATAHLKKRGDLIACDKNGKRV